MTRKHTVLEAANEVYPDNFLAEYYGEEEGVPNCVLGVEKGSGDTLDGRHHNEKAQKAYDARRDQYLRGYGFTIWRLPNTEVKAFDLEKILAAPQVEGLSLVRGDQEDAMFVWVRA